MSIILTWKEVGDVDRIKIYRSTSKINLDNLPTPIADLDASIHTSYSDVTALDNVMYNYVIEAIREPASPEAGNGYTSLSYNTKLWRLNRDTGHGPTRLIKGDLNIGDFGTVSDVEFFTDAELCSVLQARFQSMGIATRPVLPHAIWNAKTMTPYTSVDVTSPTYWKFTPNVWHKHLFNGKVIFIPERPVGGVHISHFHTWSASYQWVFRNGITWDMLFKAGAVYGTGLPYTTDRNGTVTQDMTVSKDGKTYRVRLMRLTDIDIAEKVDPDDILTKTVAGTYRDNNGHLKKGEYFSLFVPQFRDTLPISTVRRRNGRLKELSGPSVLFKGASTGAVGFIPGENLLFAERSITQNVIGSDIVFHSDPVTGEITTGQTKQYSGLEITYPLFSGINSESFAISTINTRSDYQLCYWRPVLELVD